MNRVWHFTGCNICGAKTEFAIIIKEKGPKTIAYVTDIWSS